MLLEHLDPLASSLFSLFAIASLLLSFVMLGSRWLKNYLYAFAAEFVDHCRALRRCGLLWQLS